MRTNFHRYFRSYKNQAIKKTDTVYFSDTNVFSQLNLHGRNYKIKDFIKAAKNSLLTYTGNIDNCQKSQF